MVNTRLRFPGSASYGDATPARRTVPFSHGSFRASPLRWERGAPASGRSLLLSIALILALVAFTGCGKKEDRLDHSQEGPPGDASGTYRFSPSYNEEMLIVQSGGETEYRIRKPGETLVRKGLSYRNRFRLIIFLDGDAEPTGIFLLQDREAKWPGRWKGEMRFLERTGR